MAANDAVSMNVAENRQNVPMAIQENRAAVPMTVAEGGGTPGGLNRKADKVTGAVAGNLAGLDANGNLTDSGKAPGDFLEAPAAAGSEGQVLTADGEGGASWQDPTGGDPTEIIDDTAGSGDTDKVWSADKSHSLLTEINSKYEKPDTGIPSTDMAQSVQTSLGKADSAYQKPQTGIPSSDVENKAITPTKLADAVFNEIFCAEIKEFTNWEQGTIGYSTGEESPSTTACRTIGYYIPTSDTVLNISNPDNQVYGLRKYATTGSYIGSESIGSLSSYKFLSGYKYRIACTSTGIPANVTGAFGYQNRATQKPICYNNVAEIIKDETLISGNVCFVKGYYEPSDGGSAVYLISGVHATNFYITLDNGLYGNLLVEGKTVYADAIGIKHYSTKALAETDTTGAATNKIAVQAALTAGYSVKFGDGYYSFDNYLKMVPGSNIYGVKKERSNLVFPSSIGLNFVTEQEFNSMQIMNISIHSLGNCINVDSIVRTVVNTQFDYLNLYSEEGECIVAPLYNIGSRSGDTCVWSCYFGHINGYSETGAIFANITGLGNMFYFTNMAGNTSIAFRNCSGFVQRLDTLTTRPEYCFYYDDVNVFGLSLTLIDVHFERCSKAFIYTEDETAGSMSIGIYAIDSGVSNLNLVDHDMPMIKVGRLLYLYHFGRYSLVPSEDFFNMPAIDNAIVHVKDFGQAEYQNFKTNIGGTKGLKIKSENNFYVVYSGYTNVRPGSGPYHLRPVYDEMGINRMFGGRSHKMLKITDENLPAMSTNITLGDIDDACEFADYVTFEITERVTNVDLKRIKTGDDMPGKIFGVRNSDSSITTITLNVASQSGDSTEFCLVGNTPVVLNPGESINLFLDYDGTILRWYKLNAGVSA